MELSCFLSRYRSSQNGCYWESVFLDGTAASDSNQVFDIPGYKCLIENLYWILALGLHQKTLLHFGNKLHSNNDFTQGYLTC